MGQQPAIPSSRGAKPAGFCATGDANISHVNSFRFRLATVWRSVLCILIFICLPSPISKIQSASRDANIGASKTPPTMTFQGMIVLIVCTKRKQASTLHSNRKSKSLLPHCSFAMLLTPSLIAPGRDSPCFWRGDVLIIHKSTKTTS